MSEFPFPPERLWTQYEGGAGSGPPPPKPHFHIKYAPRLFLLRTQ